MPALFSRRQSSLKPGDVYTLIVQQARCPVFYSKFGVPDTVDGRFEMVALHTFFILRRLKGEAPPAPEFSQALFDVMFDDMDIGLREMGAGDMGVGKRVKAMVQAFYGRIAAYDAGLDGLPGELDEALERNLFRSRSPSSACVEQLAAYIRRQDRHLRDLTTDALYGAQFEFALHE